MPGATVASVTCCMPAKPVKACMMPHTVPNRPDVGRHRADRGQEGQVGLRPRPSRAGKLARMARRCPSNGVPGSVMRRSRSFWILAHAAGEDALHQARRAWRSCALRQQPGSFGLVPDQNSLERLIERLHAFSADACGKMAAQRSRPRDRAATALTKPPPAWRAARVDPMDMSWEFMPNLSSTALGILAGAQRWRCHTSRCAPRPHRSSVGAFVRDGRAAAAPAAAMVSEAARPSRRYDSRRWRGSSSSRARRVAVLQLLPPGRHGTRRRSSLRCCARCKQTQRSRRQCARARKRRWLA